MHRRQLIQTGFAAAAVTALGACATSPRQPVEPEYPIASDANAQAYTADELVAAGSRELGIAAEAMGAAIERIFRDQGDAPTAYIAGEEGAGAAVIGLRYGRGALHMKDHSASQDVFWQGTSIGWDIGGNASPRLHPGLRPLCAGRDLPPLSGRRGHGLSDRGSGRELSARRRHRPGPGPHGRGPAPRRQCRHHVLQPPAQPAAVLEGGGRLVRSAPERDQRLFADPGVADRNDAPVA